jgi:hypothetical protein
MKLKKYFKNLKKFVKEHPEALEFTVVTSEDDEGNAFNDIQFKPSLGIYNCPDFRSQDENANAVCVN